MSPKSTKSDRSDRVPPDQILKIKVPYNIKRQLKERAADEGRTVQWYVVQALRAYLSGPDPREGAGPRFTTAG